MIESRKKELREKMIALGYEAIHLEELAEWSRSHSWKECQQMRREAALKRGEAERIRSELEESTNA